MENSYKTTNVLKNVIKDLLVINLKINVLIVTKPVKLVPVLVPITVNHVLEADSYIKLSVWLNAHPPIMKMLPLTPVKPVTLLVPHALVTKLTNV